MVVPFLNCSQIKGKTLGGLAAHPNHHAFENKSKTLGFTQTHKGDNLP
ncbi:MAG: hypothetical protein HQL71_03040 [Magnetococcales bacterium]|nr:hypothetical protein [Magnetococcales bacterium]